MVTDTAKLQVPQLWPETMVTKTWVWSQKRGCGHKNVGVVTKAAEVRPDMWVTEPVGVVTNTAQLVVTTFSQRQGGHRKAELCVPYSYNHSCWSQRQCGHKHYILCRIEWCQGRDVSDGKYVDICVPEDAGQG